MTQDSIMKEFAEAAELLAQNRRLLHRSTVLIEQNETVSFRPWRLLTWIRNSREIDRIHDQVSLNLAEVERLQNLGPEKKP